MRDCWQPSYWSLILISDFSLKEQWSHLGSSIILTWGECELYSVIIYLYLFQIDCRMIESTLSQLKTTVEENNKKLADLLNWLTKWERERGETNSIACPGQSWVWSYCFNAPILVWNCFSQNLTFIVCSVCWLWKECVRHMRQWWQGSGERFVVQWMELKRFLKYFPRF